VLLSGETEDRGGKFDKYSQNALGTKTTLNGEENHLKKRRDFSSENAFVAFNT